MEMDRMSSDLRLKKDVELSQAAYLKFRSVFNGSAGDSAQVYRDRGTGLVGIFLRFGTIILQMSYVEVDPSFFVC